jgi:Fe-Mn family superoxide dismutase
MYDLPELPYAASALEPLLSRELVELHHDGHHAAYVKGANETLEKLEDARRHRQFDYIGQLEKNLAFNVSGHVLHSLLWKNLTPGGNAGEPTGELAAALKQHFGSFGGFKDQLTAAAKNVQGSGWGALSWEPLGQHLLVEQVFDHQGNTGNATVPIMVVDMWEHAYYLQYRNRKAEWLDAFWQLVNWTDVAERLAKVSRTDIGL